MLGTPNAGKSELVNKLTRATVSAVSAKPNTTITPHIGAAVRGAVQLLLHDTPGVVRHEQLHGDTHTTRVQSAWSTAADADRVLFVVDAAWQVLRVGGL
jgi:small GTP-binding protein